MLLFNELSEMDKINPPSPSDLTHSLFDCDWSCGQCLVYNRLGQLCYQFVFLRFFWFNLRINIHVSVSFPSPGQNNITTDTLILFNENGIMSNMQVTCLKSFLFLIGDTDPVFNRWHWWHKNITFHVYALFFICLKQMLNIFTATVNVLIRMKGEAG